MVRRTKREYNTFFIFFLFFLFFELLICSISFFNSKKKPQLGNKTTEKYNSNNVGAREPDRWASDGTFGQCNG